MPGRFWTKHEDAVLRRWYGRKPAAEIAEELGRSVPAVTNRAGLLGLTSRQRRYTEDKRLRDWVAYFALKGWLDQEIADSWNGTRRTYRLCRRVVCDVRRALGLPANANNARHRAKVAEATRRQLERVGLGSLAEVRKEAYRRFARQRGWPEWLRPRHVQILDVLYEQGPHTRRDLAVAIGWNISRGQRALLASNYGRGSYLSDLLACGMVFRSRYRAVRGHKPGESWYLYAVSTAIRRHDPATWPEEEVARGQIYGQKQQHDPVATGGAVATAGGTDVSGSAASGRGWQRGRGGCPRDREGNHGARKKGRQARD